MNIKISIVIPIFNMADSLDLCMQSIMSQENDNFEIILVDDGSRDNSYEICCKYANKYSNVIAIHQENQGSGPARNTGIAVANGEYLLFIDSDDSLRSDALNVLNNYINDTHSDLYIFGYKTIQKDGKEKNKTYKEQLVSGRDIRHDYSPYYNQLFEWGIQGAPWNKLFKTSIVRNNQVEYPDLRRHQDEVFISRFVSNVKSVRFIEDCLYTHYANDMKLVWQKFPKNYLDIVEKLNSYRKEIIMPWNPHNKAVSALIYSEYINNNIRACFRLFNPDENMDYLTRKEWYVQNIYNRFVVEKHTFPKKLLGIKKTIQNKLFVFCVKHRISKGLDLLISLRMKY